MFLDSIGETPNLVPLRVFGAAAQALAGRVNDARAGRALDAVLDGIGRTTHLVPLRALGAAAQVLAGRVDGGIAAAAILNAIKFPTSAICDLDEVLLEALRATHSDMPPKENGFWVKVDWFRERYPHIDLESPPVRPGAHVSGNGPSR